MKHVFLCILIALSGCTSTTNPVQDLDVTEAVIPGNVHLMDWNYTGPLAFHFSLSHAGGCAVEAGLGGPKAASGTSGFLGADFDSLPVLASSDSGSRATVAGMTTNVVESDGYWSSLVGVSSDNPDEFALFGFGSMLEAWGDNPAFQYEQRCQNGTAPSRILVDDDPIVLSSADLLLGASVDEQSLGVGQVEWVADSLALIRLAVPRVQVGANLVHVALSGPEGSVEWTSNFGEAGLFMYEGPPGDYSLTIAGLQPLGQMARIGIMDGFELNSLVDLQEFLAQPN